MRWRRSIADGWISPAVTGGEGAGLFPWAARWVGYVELQPVWTNCTVLTNAEGTGSGLFVKWKFDPSNGRWTYEVMTTIRDLGERGIVLRSLVNPTNCQLKVRHRLGIGCSSARRYPPRK
jgi:hypothetical protein